jgi:uncharacterized protein (DUF2141 family)
LKFTNVFSAAACLAATAAPALAGQRIANELNKCEGVGPAFIVTVHGIEAGQGLMRVQSYRATQSDWLKSGRWLKRIEVPASAAKMRFCLPIDTPGSYAIAVRHDLNGNGKTDIFGDGGGMSNNPSISIWNLGKPGYKKVGIFVNGLTPISIEMKYR